MNGKSLFKANPMILIATMNRAEVVVHTEEKKEKYRLEEKDGAFIIYKYQRNLLGISRFKKLAQTRSRESALKMIHILTAEEILRWEVSPVDYFENTGF